MEEVRAENDFSCHAVFRTELAGGITSGEVGFLKDLGMRSAPTLGFLTPLFRTRLVVALAAGAEVYSRVDGLYTYVVNVIMMPPHV